MNKKVKRGVLIGVTAAVGAAVSAAVSYAVTKTLVSVALDRKTPKIMKDANRSVSGYTIPEELLKMREDGQHRLENEGLRTVEMTADDGTRLVGHLFCHPNAERTLIAMHGWRSSWSADYGVISEFFHSENCNVLYPEQRGQGESDGEYMGFGLTERFDCLAWARWLCDNGFSHLPMYPVGVSMGATAVLMSADLQYPGNVKGMIADCGFTSPEGIWKHVMKENLHVSYNGVRKKIVSDMVSRKLKTEETSFSAEDALRKTALPVLFIHGTDDRFVPVEMTFRNYKACAGKKYLFIVPGADHGMSYVTDTAGYKNAVRSFWKEND